MEASALQHGARPPILAGASPYLRLQSDERLIALVRRGHHGAFEALVKRYRPRLLAFCRHMLGSNEDAEDVVQDVFAAAYGAIGRDERPIQARPWLYRIARNRCLNHLRRPRAAGQESMDVFEREGGATAADTVHWREEFRLVVADVHELPETQRTALLLREIDSFSYEQIAQAMDTTVASVKSLLVRARVSLAEAAEARLLSCGEVRLALGEVAEGLGKSSPQVRRHVKSCPRCKEFKRELRNTSRALAAIYPVGPILLVKQLLATKFASGSAIGGGATAGTGTAGGLLSAGLGSKAAAGIVAAALVTAGAVEVQRSNDRRSGSADSPGARAEVPVDAAPAATAAEELADTTRAVAVHERKHRLHAAPPKPPPAPVAVAPTEPPSATASERAEPDPAQPKPEATPAAAVENTPVEEPVTADEPTALDGSETASEESGEPAEEPTDPPFSEPEPQPAPKPKPLPEAGVGSRVTPPGG